MKRVGPCIGCLTKGFNPNERPCNNCIRVDTPHIQRDKDGWPIEEATDQYSPKLTQAEIKRIHIPMTTRREDR